MTQTQSLTSSSVKKWKLFIWLQTFKQNIVASCTDLQYYVQVLNYPLRKTLKLTLSFYLIVATLQVIRFTFEQLPIFERNLTQITQQVADSFPSDTEIKWDGQTLTTFPPQMIEIPFTDETTETNFPELWLKIDTSVDSKPEQHNSFFVINKKSLYSFQFDDQYQDFPLDSVLGPDAQTFTQASIQQDISGFTSGYQEVKPLIPIGVFPFMWIGTFIVRTLMIAIDSILIYFIFSILHRPLPYKKVLQLSWHVLVPVEILHQISLLLYPNSTIPMISISYWIIMICIIWQFKNLKVIRIEKHNPDIPNQL